MNIVPLGIIRKAHSKIEGFNILRGKKVVENQNPGASNLLNATWLYPFGHFASSVRPIFTLWPEIEYTDP
jgi:hypothetical protein